MRFRYVDIGWYQNKRESVTHSLREAIPLGTEIQNMGAENDSESGRMRNVIICRQNVCSLIAFETNLKF